MTTTWHECQVAYCECYIDFSFSYYKAPVGPAWCADVSEEQQEKKTKDKLNEHKTNKQKQTNMQTNKQANRKKFLNLHFTNNKFISVYG